MKSIEDERYDNYGYTLTSATGSQSGIDESVEIEYPFEQFVVVIQLDKQNVFKGISEIRVNKDFRSLQQRIASNEYADIEDYYKD